MKEITVNSTVNLRKIFEEYLKLSVADGNASLDTLRTYWKNVARYLVFATKNQWDVVHVTPIEIKRYREFLLSQNKKPATIYSHLSAVRRFYDALVEKGLILSNPAEKVKAPKEISDPADRISYLDEVELRHLFNAIPRDHSLLSVRDRLIIAIMALEGARTVELHRANIKDVLTKNEGVGIRVHAKRHARVIPLRQDIAKLLKIYLALRERIEPLYPSQPLFIGLSKNKPFRRLTRRAYRWIVDKYLKLADLKFVGGKKISTHSLRHTAGTLGYQATHDIRQVQDLLGHVSPATTAIYVHAQNRFLNNPALQIKVNIGGDFDENKPVK